MGMATYSSILGWRIPWTEEPGGLQTTGLQRVGYDSVTNTHAQSLESQLLTHPKELSTQIKWGRRDGNFCEGCSCLWLRDREGGDGQS